jgi:hypothetical protein
MRDDSEDLRTEESERSSRAGVWRAGHEEDA